MTIKSYLLFGFVALLHSSCSTHPSHHLTAPGEARPDFYIADKLVHGISQKLTREGIYSYTTGGMYFPTIRLITNDYATRNYQFTSTDQAKILFCAIVDMYLSAFNNEPRIRPYLKNFPFTQKNIELSLAFLDVNGKPLPAGFISEVRNNNGYIIYQTHNQNGEPIIASKENFEGAYRQYLKHKKDGRFEKLSQ